MTIIRFHPEMALLCDLGVNLRDFLCDILCVCFKRNPLISLSLPKIADFRDISAVLNMSSSKLSSRIEASVGAAVGTRMVNDKPVTEFLQGGGYTGTDVLGVDIGGIGINQVGNETVVPDSGKEYTPSGQTYTPGGSPYP